MFYCFFCCFFLFKATSHKGTECYTWHGMQPIFQQNLIIQPADSLTSFTPLGHIAVNACSGTCRLGGNFHRNFRIVSQMMGGVGCRDWNQRVEDFLFQREKELMADHRISGSEIPRVPPGPRRTIAPPTPFPQCVFLQQSAANDSRWGIASVLGF